MKKVILNPHNIALDDIEIKEERVKVLPINSDNKLLLCRINGIYHFVGGHPDSNESINECAKREANDELSKSLKLLNLLDFIDKDNPMKLFKEANLYAQAGDESMKNEILAKIDTVFPSYFLSHYKFSDIYENKDLLMICFLLELKIFDKYTVIKPAPLYNFISST